MNFIFLKIRKHKNEYSTQTMWRLTAEVKNLAYHYTAIVRRHHELLTFNSQATSMNRESSSTSVISQNNSYVINGQYARKHESRKMSAVSLTWFSLEKRRFIYEIILGQISLTLRPFMHVSLASQPVHFHCCIQGIMNRLLFHR